MKHYLLEEKNYRYLPRKTIGVEENNAGGASNDPSVNAKKYIEVLHLLEVLEFEPDQIEIVEKILAAIILIGEITFKETADDGSEVVETDIADKSNFPIDFSISLN